MAKPAGRRPARVRVRDRLGTREDHAVGDLPWLHHL